MARAGMPAFSVAAGMTLKGKPVDFAKKACQEFTEKAYHTPQDEMRPDWDCAGFAVLARFIDLQLDDLRCRKGLPARGHQNATARQAAPLNAKWGFNELMQPIDRAETCFGTCLVRGTFASARCAPPAWRVLPILFDQLEYHQERLGRGGVKDRGILLLVRHRQPVPCNSWPGIAHNLSAGMTNPK